MGRKTLGCCVSVCLFEDKEGADFAATWVDIRKFLPTLEWLGFDVKEVEVVSDRKLCRNTFLFLAGLCCESRIIQNKHAFSQTILLCFVQTSAVFDDGSWLFETDYSDYNVFLFLFAGHGCAGDVMLGKDGETEIYSVNRLVEKICRLDSLRGIPKLFLMDMCRGGEFEDKTRELCVQPAETLSNIVVKARGGGGPGGGGGGGGGGGVGGGGGRDRGLGGRGGGGE